MVVEEIGTLVLSIKGGLHLVGATPMGDMLFAPQLLLKGADLIDCLASKALQGILEVVEQILHGHLREGRIALIGILRRLVSELKQPLTILLT